MPTRPRIAPQVDVEGVVRPRPIDISLDLRHDARFAVTLEAGFPSELLDRADAEDMPKALVGAYMIG